MQTSLIGRIVLGIAVVAAAVVLLVVLSDSGEGDGGGASDAPKANAQGSGSAGNGQGDDAPAREAAVPTIVIEDGSPVGGVEELTFDAGDRIRFAVRSNTADEVHVHGYDVERKVGPDRVASFDFPATIEGLFEAELHGSGEQIAELRIEP
jgi:hypothetical protein